ncbi:hypothetical protein [Frateuria sp. Soil773]|uniref:hypothetical protein n=1 Tax=Frateuria sp. Soil773 TaxID=1736407 RepID=UPI0012F890BA|nr:hypothetical protein [Frateuria sp. Soil773]
MSRKLSVLSIEELPSEARWFVMRTFAISFMDSGDTKIVRARLSRSGYVTFEESFISLMTPIQMCQVVALVQVLLCDLLKAPYSEGGAGGFKSWRESAEHWEAVINASLV